MTLQRYLTRLIWIGTLPLLLLATWFGIGHLQDDHEHQRESAERLLATARSVVDETLRARLSGLQTLASSPLADSPQGWPGFHREALGYLAAFGNHVALVDAQRRSRLHTAVPLGEPPPPAPRPAGRSAIQEAFERATPAVGDRFQGTVANEPLVGLAVPGLRDGRVEFVVGSVVPLRQIDELLARLPIHSGWSLTLLDSQGATLVRHGDLPPEAASAEGLEMDDRLALAPWSLHVRASEALITRKRTLAIAGLVALVLGALTAGLVGGRFASRRLSRSVQTLSAPPDQRVPPPDIAEIRSARALIEETAAERDRAAAGRRETEQLYRQRLERNAAELQMREAELRSVLTSASDAIIVADAAQTVVMANPAAARLFGWPGGLPDGVALQQLCSEPLRTMLGRAIDAATAQDPDALPEGRRFDMVGLRADGSECAIEASLARVDFAGRAMCTVVLRDVTDSRRLQAELSSSQAELRALMGQHLRVEENERRRIARELHDELQQVLVAIKMEVAAVERAVAADPKRLKPLLERIDRLAGAAIAATRRVVSDLRPLMLEELGLVPALEALCQQFEQRTGIAATVAAGTLLQIGPGNPEQVEICLYRVAQESLTNVAKHSGATEVRIELMSDADGTLRMCVCDDGRGLPRDRRRSPMSFGLKGMGERVRALGGALRVESGPQGGVTVHVEIARPAEGSLASGSAASLPKPH